jgi:hypothetical protein
VTAPALKFSVGVKWMTIADASQRAWFGHLEEFYRPHHGVGSLAGEEERAEAREVVLRDQLARRVMMSSHRGSRGNQSPLRNAW